MIKHRDGTGLTEPMSVPEEADHILSFLTDGCLLLAEDAGSLLGFQSVNRLSLELVEIVTFGRRESRASGVGWVLLRNACSWAGREGVSALLAAIDERNGPGLQAYRAWGFAEPAADWLDFHERSLMPGTIPLVSTA